MNKIVSISAAFLLALSLNANASADGKKEPAIQLQKFDVSTRYRVIENSDGQTTNSQLQYNVSIAGRLRLDGPGKYSLNVGAGSGNSITSGWNSLDIGRGGEYQGFDNIFVKQLYLSAKPGSGLELQLGGIGFNRGLTTEVTSYDNDAYLMGARATLKRPDDLFFDEVSVTIGQLDDYKDPNVFQRFDSLGRTNYRQVLVLKNVTGRFSVSGDVTNHSGDTTLRQTLVFKKPGLGLSLLRIELYARTTNKSGSGFAFYGEKTYSKRLTVGGGFAQIDRDFGGLNGDRYNKGKRIFAQGSYRLSDRATVEAFVTQGFGNDFAVSNKTRFDAIVKFDASKLFGK